MQLPPVRILVVEDEASQREILRYNLEAEGYAVQVAADGDEALLLLAEETPDLVLLDWMLPGTSGIEICRQLKRRAGAPPVIMLSARSEDVDKIRGLDTGADDYMAKPFSIKELQARIRTQLRRTRPASTGEVLRHGDIELDPERHRVSRAGQAVPMGPTEFRLLTAMLERPGRVWSREALLTRVWGDREAELDTRTVDVHVGRLRKALTSFGAPDPIRTVRGAGYALGE